MRQKGQAWRALWRQCGVSCEGVRNCLREAPETGRELGYPELGACFCLRCTGIVGHARVWSRRLAEPGLAPTVFHSPAVSLCPHSSRGQLQVLGTGAYDTIGNVIAVSQVTSKGFRGGGSSAPWRVPSRLSSGLEGGARWPGSLQAGSVSVLTSPVAVGPSRTPALCTNGSLFVSGGSWVLASRFTVRNRYSVYSKVPESGDRTCAPRSHSLDPAASW